MPMDHWDGKGFQPLVSKKEFCHHCMTASPIHDSIHGNYAPWTAKTTRACAVITLYKLFIQAIIKKIKNLKRK